MIPSILRATETFLTELNPYVPIDSCLTGIVMTADGLSRMIRHGPSKRALAETTIGVALTALSYYSLDKISQRPALEAQKRWCDLTVAKATTTTQAVLNNSLMGLNTTDIAISCQLQESSRSFLSVISPKNFPIHTMYNDCLVTIKSPTQRLWLEQTTTQLCIPITETATYRAHHFGAADPILSRLIADIRFKILG